MTKGSAVRVFIRWGCELRCIPQVGVRFARVREECRRSTIFFVRFRRFMPRKVTSIYFVPSNCRPKSHDTGSWNGGTGTGRIEGLVPRSAVPPCPVLGVCTGRLLFDVLSPFALLLCFFGFVCSCASKYFG